VKDTVLVTGAAGFAGSHLVQLLAARGPVTAWARSAPPPEILELATWQRVDLLDRQAVMRAVREVAPAEVYHCAGSPHVAQSWSDMTTPLSVNVMATHHLLEALGALGTRPRVLVTGSAMVYGPSATPIAEGHPLRPGSPYAVTKLAQEQLALRAVDEDHLDVIVARSFNHTGPRQTPAFAAASFARQVARIEQGDEPVIRVGSLEALRDLTDVRDVVRAYAALMEKGASGTAYNVASGIGRPIRALVDGLAARSRVPVRIAVDEARMRPNDVPVLVGDPSLLKATTGWEPQVSFDRMLDDLLDYWRAQPSS
jgi:GDP-4-dehydro-6-deoxy-D-mannose reductase